MEQALSKFANYWKNKQEVIGILLGGSFAIGLANNNSDVDIRLLLSNDCKHTFKGLHEIDGYSFSYLGRTESNIAKKLNTDFFNNIKIEARVIHLGEIIYDKFNLFGKLKQVAHFYYELPFTEKSIVEDDLKAMMYSLHSRYEYLMNTEIHSPFFLLNYVTFMKLALDFYAAKLNIELMVDTKLEKLLMDKNYTSKYNINVFPDQTFIELWISCLSVDAITKKNIETVFSYMKKKIFNINEKKFHMLWLE